MVTSLKERSWEIIQAKPIVYNDGLTGLRFFCFFFVFNSHGLVASAYKDLFHTGLVILSGNAVAVFFVLSGFLISRLLVKNQTGDLRCDLKTFYIRRALRIFPIYYLTLIILSSFGMLSDAPWFFSYTYNIKSFLSEPTNTGIRVAWSLCVEEQFYLLFPLLLLVTNEKWRIKMICVLIFLSVMTGLICNQLIPEKDFYCLLPVVGQYLLWGALAALLEMKIAEKNVNSTKLFWSGGLLSIATFCLNLFIPDAWIYCMLPYGVAFAMVIFAIWRAKPEGLFLIFNNKIAVYLGQIAYGLYLFHALVTFELMPRLFGPEYFYIKGLIGTLVLAILSWHLFEKPINQLKDKLAPVSKAAKL